MKIYTKKGDTGQTSLFGGQAVAKGHPRLEAYGTVDELNCTLGLALASQTWPAPLKALADTLLNVQSYLFTLGSHLALGDLKLKSQLPPFDPQAVQSLEIDIDKMQAELPTLRQFILPGGSELSARLHLARAVARRAERLVAQLGSEVDQEILIYLNRLSDFLFVAARYVNFKLQQSDTPWSKNK